MLDPLLDGDARHYEWITGKGANQCCAIARQHTATRQMLAMKRRGINLYADFSNASRRVG